MFKSTGTAFGIPLPNRKHYVDRNPLPYHPAQLLDRIQINRLLRKNLTVMLALFITSIAVFIYMVYVLLKPEKF